MAKRGGTDVWRLTPVDSPEEPHKGMYFWVQTGDHWAAGERYTISRVNERSFYVSVDGRKERIDRRGWHSWLRERSEEGYVILDGHPLKDPQSEPFAIGLSAPVTGTRVLHDAEDEEQTPNNSRGTRMNANLRDARLLRAVRDVLKRYSFSRSESVEGELLKVEVARKGATYQVEIDPAWHRPPR